MMRNRALTFSLLVLLAAGAGKMFADELVLLTPKSEKLNVNSMVTISWDYTFMEWQPQNAEQRKLRIELYRGWISESLIAEVDCNSSGYSWKVPALDQTARRIVITMANKPSLRAMSPEFKIVHPAIIVTKVPFKVFSAIKILVPQAGETYLIGSTMHITWDTDKIADHPQVWVQTCWPNHSAAAGAFPTANSGHIDWNIQETQENDLCIKVWTHGGDHTGFSGVFHIKKP
jgi:hypothetical protein